MTDPSSRSTHLPSVTVSILCYRDLDTIADCVSSVLELDYGGELDIRIREQGQDDAQFAAVKEVVDAAGDRPGRHVTLSRGDNVGFAPGHNIAMREGSGDLVLLVNADAVVDPSLLTRAVPHFDAPDVGAVQAKVLKRDADNHDAPVSFDTTGLLPSRRRLIFNRAQGEPDRGQYDQVEEIFGVDGALALYRRAALEDVAVPVGGRAGGPVEYLDETFFIYKCDVDIAWRLRWRGWRALYVPEALAWHGRSMQRSPETRSFRDVYALRKASPEMGRYLSFGNHRLMQLKDESLRGLLRDLPVWLFYELGTWVFFVLTEGGLAFRSIARLARLSPAAFRKRRLVQSRRAPTANPYAWFD